MSPATGVGMDLQLSRRHSAEATCISCGGRILSTAEVGCPLHLCSLAAQLLYTCWLNHRLTAAESVHFSQQRLSWQGGRLAAPRRKRCLCGGCAGNPREALQ